MTTQLVDSEWDEKNVGDVVQYLLDITGHDRVWLAAQFARNEDWIKSRMGRGKAHRRWTVPEIKRLSMIFGVPEQTFFEPVTALFREDIRSLAAAQKLNKPRVFATRFQEAA